VGVLAVELVGGGLHAEVRPGLVDHGEDLFGRTARLGGRGRRGAGGATGRGRRAGGRRRGTAGRGGGGGAGWLRGFSRLGWGASRGRGRCAATGVRRGLWGRVAASHQGG